MLFRNAAFLQQADVVGPRLLLYFSRLMSARIRSRYFSADPSLTLRARSQVPRFGTANYPYLNYHNGTNYAMVLGRRLRGRIENAHGRGLRVPESTIPSPRRAACWRKGNAPLSKEGCDLT